MGLFDWIRGGQPSAPTVPEVTFTPPAGSKPFGVDKPISECNDEDIQASREALWKAGADVIKGWRYDAGCDRLGRATEEGLGEVLGGRGGYGSGLTSPSLPPPTEVL